MTFCDKALLYGGQTTRQHLYGTGSSQVSQGKRGKSMRFLSSLRSKRRKGKNLSALPINIDI